MSGKHLINSWTYNWVSKRRGRQTINLDLYECSSFWEKDYIMLELTRRDNSVFYSFRTYKSSKGDILCIEHTLFSILYAIILDRDFIGFNGGFQNECINERDREILRHFNWTNGDDYKIDSSLSYEIHFEGFTDQSLSLNDWIFIQTLIPEWEMPQRGEERKLDLIITKHRAYLILKENKRIVHEFENPDHIFSLVSRYVRSRSYIFYDLDLIKKYYEGC